MHGRLQDQDIYKICEFINIIYFIGRLAVLIVNITSCNETLANRVMCPRLIIHPSSFRCGGLVDLKQVFWFFFFLLSFKRSSSEGLLFCYVSNGVSFLKAVWSDFWTKELLSLWANKKQPQNTRQFLPYLLPFGDRFWGKYTNKAAGILDLSQQPL